MAGRRYAYYRGDRSSALAAERGSDEVVSNNRLLRIGHVSDYQCTSSLNSQDSSYCTFTPTKDNQVFPRFFFIVTLMCNFYSYEVSTTVAFLAYWQSITDMFSPSFLSVPFFSCLHALILFSPDPPPTIALLDSSYFFFYAVQLLLVIIFQITTSQVIKKKR